MSHRPRAGFAALMCVALAGSAQLSCSGPALPEQGTELASAPRLRVLTYNLNYGLSGDAAGLEAISEADADLVLLQEVTPRWARALELRFARDYPYREYAPGQAAAGLALLSRYPVSAELVDNPISWFPSQRAVVDTPRAQVQVLNVHLRPPFADDGSIVKGYFSTGEVRAQEIAHFCAALEPGLATLVAGDLNENDGAASRFLRQRGMVDALAELGSRDKTWRWQLPLITLRQTLDHIYIDSERFSAVSAEVLQRGRSDHLPVVVDLALRR